MLSWTKMSHHHATNTNFNEQPAKEPGLPIQICPDVVKEFLFLEQDNPQNALSYQKPSFFEH